MIQVDNLTKYYGDVAAIRDVSFSVDKGEILAFLGPNGAGKTTTMRILTAYMPPSAGFAQVAGYDVFNDSLEVRRRVGYMPETVPLYPEMTVRSYLDFAARLRGVDDRRKRVGAAMETCHVANYAETAIPVEVYRHIQHHLLASDRRGGWCVCLVEQEIGVQTGKEQRET